MFAIANMITKKKEYSYTTGTPASWLIGHSYTYNSTYKDLLIAYDGETITYDEMARPTSYRGKNVTWILGKLFDYGDASFDYLYDNTRISKTVGGVTTHYDYHEGRLLGEHRSGTGGAKDIRYLYDQSGIIGFTLNGTVYRYIKNLLGDIIAIYQGATKVAEYVYDAWGNCTTIKDLNGIGTLNPIRYRGYYYDVETGLYYLMSRYYDPATGRFISPDDVSYLDPETIQGLNLFAYCGNNPVMGTDPEGHGWLFVALTTFVNAIAGAIVGAVDYALNNDGEFNGGEFKKYIIAGALSGAASGFILGITKGKDIKDASYAAAFVYSAVCEIGDYIIGTKDLTSNNIKKSLGTVLADTAIYGSLNYIGNWIGSKLFPTNSGWFTPTHFLSYFTKTFGQRMIAQTVVAAGFSTFTLAVERFVEWVVDLIKNFIS